MAKNEHSVSSRKRLRRLGWIGLGVLGLIVLAMIPGYRLWEYYCGRAVESNAVLTLPTGSDFRALVDSLESAAVLHNPKRFEKWAHSRDLDSSVHPGRYRLDAGMSYSSLINMLKSGRQTPVRVTFNNLRTPARMAGVLARKLEPDSLTWVHTLMSDSLAKQYGSNPVYAVYSQYIRILLEYDSRCFFTTDEKGDGSLLVLSRGKVGPLWFEPRGGVHIGLDRLRGDEAYR